MPNQPVRDVWNGQVQIVVLMPPLAFGWLQIEHGHRDNLVANALTVGWASDRDANFHTFLREQLMRNAIRFFESDQHVSGEARMPLPVTDLPVVIEQARDSFVGCPVCPQKQFLTVPVDAESHAEGTLLLHISQNQRAIVGPGFRFLAVAAAFLIVLLGIQHRAGWSQKPQMVTVERPFRVADQFIIRQRTNQIAPQFVDEECPRRL
ncbi:MAG: hypothetical protein RKR03_04130 [Candidatus Competibacter sp.]|nr:hypothetical protein [Candidatus Competibacter sp.]